MKKALVFYLYGNRNAGDMAICMGTIEFLKQQGYDITMVSRFSEAENEYQNSKKYVEEYYPEVKVFPGPFSFERDYSKLEKLAAYGKSYLKVLGFLRDDRTKNLIKEADVVFFNGGNLLRASSTTDYLRLVGLFYPISIAHKLGKTIYCLPQSTAKISNCGERILRNYLRFFDTVYIREKLSFAELKKRFPEMSFVQSTDMAFLCKDTETASRKYAELGIKIKEKTVALVVRNTSIGDIGKLDIEKQRILQEYVIAFVEAQPEYNYIVVVQTEKDYDFSLHLLQMIKKYTEAKMIEEHDPLVLREIYKHVDFLVTMRLHAGILALSALTPVIGVFSNEWGMKNPGIMNDYGMQYVVIENIGKEILDMPTISQRKGIAQNIDKYSKILRGGAEKINIIEK